MRRVLQIAVVIATIGTAVFLGVFYLGCCYVMRWSVFGEVVPDSYLAPVPPLEIARAMAAGNVSLVSFWRLPFTSTWFQTPFGSSGALAVLVIAGVLGLLLGLLAASRIPSSTRRGRRDQPTSPGLQFSGGTSEGAGHRPGWSLDSPPPTRRADIDAREFRADGAGGAVAWLRPESVLMQPLPIQGFFEFFELISGKARRRIGRAWDVMLWAHMPIGGALFIAWMAGFLFCFAVQIALSVAFSPLAKIGLERPAAFLALWTPRLLVVWAGYSMLPSWHSVSVPALVAAYAIFIVGVWLIVGLQLAVMLALARLVAAAEHSKVAQIIVLLLAAAVVGAVLNGILSKDESDCVVTWTHRGAVCE